jgi:hypothetical protein
VQPVYLPLVHQLARYLAHYEQPQSWQTVGQVLDLPAANGRGDRIVVTPSGQRIAQTAGGAGLVELNEQGIYEIRGATVPGATDSGAKVPGAKVPGAAVPGATSRPRAIAVNLDPTESDLTPLDPRELVAAVTGHATPVAAQPLAPEATREDAEKRQALWWYLLLAGLVLLAAEMSIANRLSRREKFL